VRKKNLMVDYRKLCTIGGVAALMTVLMVFEILVSFVWTLGSAAIALAMFGGLLSTVWYVLSGLKLFRLGSDVSLGAGKP
jgi:hypothetical protein